MNEPERAVEITPVKLSCVWDVYRQNDTVLVKVKVFDVLRCGPQRRCIWDGHGEDQGRERIEGSSGAVVKMGEKGLYS